MGKNLNVQYIGTRGYDGSPLGGIPFDSRQIETESLMRPRHVSPAGKTPKHNEINFAFCSLWDLRGVKYINYANVYGGCCNVGITHEL